MPTGYVDEEILKIANAIQHYLLNHPNAADSLEGISKWWLAGQQPACSPNKVQEALDYLVEIGVVRRVTTVGVETVYVSSDKSNHSTRH